MVKVSPPCFQTLSHIELRKKINLFLNKRSWWEIIEMQQGKDLSLMTRSISFFIISLKKICLAFFFLPLFSHVSLLVSLSSLDLVLTSFFYIDKLLSPRFSSQHKLLSVLQLFLYYVFGSVHLPLFSQSSCLSMDLNFFFSFVFCQVHSHPLFHCFLLPFQMLSLLFIPL